MTNFRQMTSKKRRWLRSKGEAVYKAVVEVRPLMREGVGNGDEGSLTGRLTCMDLKEENGNVNSDQIKGVSVKNCLGRQTSMDVEN